MPPNTEHRTLNTAQPELDFAACASLAQRVCTEHDLKVLEGYMLTHRQALRAEIAAALNWPERKVRHVAAESNIILRSPGMRGYRLIEDAEPAEIYAAVGRIRAQMGKMELTLAHYLNVAGLKVALGKQTEGAR